MIGWAMMEIIRDKALFQVIKAEVSTVFVADPTSRKHKLDVAKLVELPLLQSVYVMIRCVCKVCLL